jgi:predicted PilT family ATPase
MKNSLRILTAVFAVATLAACSDNSPVGVIANIDSAAQAKGSNGGGVAATTTTITLSAPANAAFRSAKGKAKFSVSANEREIQVEVENVPAGTVLNFSVGGVSLGSATADAFGKARINRNSKLGDAVPMSVAGLAVSVTTAGGATVVTGAF